ncbi:MAG: trigger factor [Actinomycetota bacterium]
MTNALTTEITPLENDRVRLDVAVAEDEVRRRTDATIREIARNVRIPGFRPGKAPANVIVQRMGRDYVLQKMVEDSLGRWYAQAVEDTGIDPIDDPEVDFDGPPESGDLTFTATVRTRPKATLGTYKGIEVGREEVVVEEAAVDAEIERLREQVARLQPVERAAAQGDFVTIDFTGAIDGTPVPNGSGRDYLIEIGGRGLMPGFDERVVGLAGGETTAFTVDYPEDDQRPALAGKSVEYTVTVKQVQEKVLPPLDDELAPQISEFDTLAELRADVESRLRTAVEARVNELFRRAVIDAVAREATVEVPDVMVQRRVSDILHETMHRLPRGLTLEAYIQAIGKTPQQVVEELTPDATMSIRRELAVEAVAEAEGIEVSDEDLEAQVRTDAEAAGRDADELLAQVASQGAKEQLRKDLVRERAMTFLVESAVPITMEQAAAREKLWTPESKDPEAATPKLWTPGQPEPPPATRKSTPKDA